MEPMRCNCCQTKITPDREMVRDAFCGQKAARVQEFCKCPECGRSDHHWVYAMDIMPKFEGGFDKRRQLERDWLRAN